MSRFLLPADYVATYGTDGPAWSREDALAYTRWLARSHYENFHVASLLLPADLHQDFFNIYAFCRWADDLGDEIGDAGKSLELLAWWRGELAEMYYGAARHPVFLALEGTVGKSRIPLQPFEDLIRAFEQDQTVHHYRSWAELLEYCRHSANPVGRLVLRLCGYTDARLMQLSDFTCTALQLANFWQDVRRDWALGRVYMPTELMASYDYSVEALAEDIARGEACNSFQALMRELVDRTEVLFLQGGPLADQVNPRLAIDLDLFSRGGLTVLELIRLQNYDVIRRRPQVRTLARMVLLLGAVSRRLRRFAGPREARRGQR